MYGGARRRGGDDAWLRTLERENVVARRDVAFRREIILTSTV
jgi:hypothetical protein